MSTEELLKNLLGQLSTGSNSGSPPHPKTKEQIAQEVHENQVKDSNQIRWLRWILAGVIVLIALAHLGVLYYFLDKNGNQNLLIHQQFISDHVMLMFLGTTTADIFGLLFILFRYVFPNHNR